MNNKPKNKTSQELINLIHKLMVKPLLRIPAKQTFTLSHNSRTWLVSLTIVSTHKDSSGKLMNNQLKAYTKQLLKYIKGKKIT